MFRANRISGAIGNCNARESVVPACAFNAQIHLDRSVKPRFPFLWWPRPPKRPRFMLSSSRSKDTALQLYPLTPLAVNEFDCKHMEQLSCLVLVTSVEHSIVMQSQPWLGTPVPREGYTVSEILDNERRKHPQPSNYQVLPLIDALALDLTRLIVRSVCLEG